MPHIILAAALRAAAPRRACGPAWLLRLGLFLYDHLGGRKILPPHAHARPAQRPGGRAAEAGVRQGLRIFRLLGRRRPAGGAERPRRRGARRGDPHPHPRSSAPSATATAGGCGVGRRRRRRDVRAQARGQRRRPLGRASVIRDGFGGDSAGAGPAGAGAATSSRRRLFDHDRAYIFQQADGRIVFAIPYESDFTLIGTTDVDHEGDAGRGGLHAGGDRLSARRGARVFRARRSAPSDIVWTYSGVRPLYDDGASSATAATRDYVLELDAAAARRRCCRVFGGKITTYRRLAEAALAQARATSSRGCAAPGPPACRCPAATSRSDGAPALAADCWRRYPFLDARWAARLVRAYGTEAAELLAGARHGGRPRRALRRGPDRARGRAG